MRNGKGLKVDHYFYRLHHRLTAKTRGTQGYAKAFALLSAPRVFAVKQKLVEKTANYFQSLLIPYFSFFISYSISTLRRSSTAIFKKLGIICE